MSAVGNSLRWSILLAVIGATVVYAFGRSPFLPVGNGTAESPAAAEEAALEFRGMIDADGESLFGLYDTHTHKSRWVRLNDPNEPFLVKSFEPTANSVTVEFQGRSLQLTLKSAKIQTLALAANAPGADGGPQAEVAGGGRSFNQKQPRPIVRREPSSEMIARQTQRLLERTAKENDVRRANGMPPIPTLTPLPANLHPNGQ